VGLKPISAANWLPSVLLHCSLGHQACKSHPRMTYKVSSGTLSLYSLLITTPRHKISITQFHIKTKLCSWTFQICVHTDKLTYIDSSWQSFNIESRIFNNSIGIICFCHKHNKLCSLLQTLSSISYMWIYMVDKLFSRKDLRFAEWCNLSWYQLHFTVGISSILWNFKIWTRTG